MLAHVVPPPGAAPVAGHWHQLITWSAHGGSFRGSGAETAASVDIVDIVNKYTASIPHSHIPPDRVLIVVEQRDLAVATCSCSTVGREKLDSG